MSDYEKRMCQKGETEIDKLPETCPWCGCAVRMLCLMRDGSEHAQYECGSRMPDNFQSQNCQIYRLNKVATERAELIDERDKKIASLEHALEYWKAQVSEMDAKRKSAREDSDGFKDLYIAEEAKANRAVKLLVEIRRAAACRYLSPDLLDRVRRMIEEHDGMISVEEVDAELKLPDGFSDERKQDTDPPSIEEMAKTNREQEETIAWQGKLIASLLRGEKKLKSELLNATKYSVNCEAKNEGKQDIIESLVEQCNDKDDTINSLIDQRDEARQENAKLREERDRYLAEINEADECRKWATEVLETVKKERDSARDERDKLRNELATLKATAPYRVENQQPATVEQGEWKEAGDASL